MSKMGYFSNIFSKIAKCWRLSAPSASLPFDIGDLKLRDLAKLWCFKLIMAKSNFWTFQWRHHNYVTKIKSQKFSSLAPPNQNFWLRQWIKVIVIVILYF